MRTWIKNNRLQLSIFGLVIALLLSYKWRNYDVAELNHKRETERKMYDSTVASERNEKLKLMDELLTARLVNDTLKRDLKSEKRQTEKLIRDQNKEHIKHVQIYNDNDAAVIDRLKRAQSAIRQSKRRQPKLQ